MDTKPALFVLALGILLPAASGAQQTDPVSPGAPRVEREGTLKYRDARLGKMIPPRSWQLFISRENKKDKDYGPSVDPKFNITYPGKVQVMCSTDEEGRNPERVFVVHFMKPEDEPLARRAGAVIARIYWLGIDYLGVFQEPGRYINVWLARHGEPGAEEFQKNIYLFAIDRDRAPAEWMRELAHEYSHIVLPPVGEYSAPEKWANGYFGERLFLKWLLLDNAVTDAWDRPVDGAAYVAKELVPLRNRYLNAGPGSPLADKMDAQGMDYFIGQVLSVEATFGPTVLRQLFANYATRRPQSLGSYLSAGLQSLKPAQFPIDPAVYVPEKSQVEPSAPGVTRVRKAAYWLYLAGGTWQITLTGTLPEGTSVTLEGSPLKKATSTPALASWETEMPGANGAWRRLELAPPAGQILELQAINVVRRDTGS